MRFEIEHRFSIRGWHWAGVDTLSGEVVTRGTWVSVSNVVRELNRNLPVRLTQADIDSNSGHSTTEFTKRAVVTCHKHTFLSRIRGLL